MFEIFCGNTPDDQQNAHGRQSLLSLIKIGDDNFGALISQTGQRGQ